MRISKQVFKSKIPLKHGDDKRSLLNRGFSKNAKGTTSVEFAIVSGLFFLLLFAVIDFSLYGFVKHTMQHAVREGARYAITGQTDLDPEDENNRKRAVIQKIKNSSLGFFETVTSEARIQVTDGDGQPVVGFGEPGDSIVVTLNCNWPILNPFSQALLVSSDYNFSVRASMRNETFPGSIP